MNQPTRGRLKRPNFLQHRRVLERRNFELLDHMPKPIPAVKNIPSWKRGQLPRVCTKVPGVADKGCQPELERKSLTLEYVNIKYPEDHIRDDPQHVVDRVSRQIINNSLYAAALHPGVPEEARTDSSTSAGETAVCQDQVHQNIRRRRQLLRLTNRLLAD